MWGSGSLRTWGRAVKPKILPSQGGLGSSGAKEGRPTPPWLKKPPKVKPVKPKKKAK